MEKEPVGALTDLQKETEKRYPADLPQGEVGKDYLTLQEVSALKTAHRFLSANAIAVGFLSKPRPIYLSEI